MTRISKSLLCSGGLVLSGILAAAVLIPGAGRSRPALPNPNGYDDFVRAGQEVNGDVSRFQEMDEESLSALITTNADSLRLVRVGLTRKSLMPIEEALANPNYLSGQLAEMKRLAQLLGAEGRLYELNNQTANAARTYTEIIRLGNEISRGALLITRLVGISIESMGCRGLTGILPRLDRTDSHALVAELEKIDTTRVTWDEVVQGEKSCSRYHRAREINPVIWFESWWNLRQALPKAEARHNIAVAHERLITTELALRSYQSEKGNTPQSLEELTTNYLSKVPQDPFGQHPLIYHPT